MAFTNGSASPTRHNVLGCVALLLVLVVFGVVLALLVNNMPSTVANASRRQLMSKVSVGMLRKEVIAGLGPPTSVARSRSDFTRTNSYTPVPPYPVDREVLEYYSYIWKMYVYIDRRDKVSRVVFART
jgi:hypothetical protein